MSNSLKRLLSFALAVIMCVSLLPGSALAEELGADEQLEENTAAIEPAIEEKPVESVQTEAAPEQQEAAEESAMAESDSGMQANLAAAENGDSIYDEQWLREEIDSFTDCGGTINLYDSIALTKDLTIPGGVSLNIFDGGKLTVPKGKKLIFSSDASVYIQNGELEVAGSLINNGRLEVHWSVISAASYSGDGEFYEQVDEPSTISGSIAKAKRIAKKYVNNISEIDDFCSEYSGDYLRMVADAGELDIDEDYTLPERFTLNAVPLWDNEGNQITGYIKIDDGVTLTVGATSGLAASANTVIDLYGHVACDGVIRTDRYQDDEVEYAGRILVEGSGSLISNGETGNYGTIEVNSDNAELKINEDNYDTYYNYICILIRSTEAELNNLSEDKCVLILEADDMDALKSCLETEGWSVVNVYLNLDVINDDITVGKGFSIVVPTDWDVSGALPHTVEIAEGVSVIISPEGQLGFEYGAKAVNNGAINVFGQVCGYQDGVKIENNGTIKNFNGYIDNVDITGNEVIENPDLQPGGDGVYSNYVRYQFTAQDEGWYLFKLSGEQLNGFGYSYTPDDDNSWTWLYETDTASVYLEAGQSVGININSWSGNPELIGIDISSPLESQDYDISTGDCLVAGNDFADVELTFSASGDEEYEYGIIYAPKDEERIGGGMEWFNGYRQISGITSGAPASDQTVTMKSLQTIPGTEYMYQAFIAVGKVEDGEEDNRDYYFGEMKCFSTIEMDAEGFDKFTELELDETITPDGYAYYFDIPQDSDDMYAVILEGYDCSIQVYNGEGYYRNEFQFENSDGVHMVAVRKPADEAERLYIYAGMNGNDSCRLTVEKEDAIGLHSGENNSLSNYQVYSYTAPEAGNYSLSTWDGCRIWGYYQYSGGWQQCGNNFETYAEKGENLFVLLEWGNDITVKRYDNEGRRVVSTAAELTDSFYNGNGEDCIIEGNITLPLPAGQSGYYYCTGQHIIIADGGSLTVPNRVTFSAEGYLEICEGGKLIIGRGGRFENNGFTEVKGTVSVEKTGELQNNSDCAIQMFGGEIAGEGDIYNYGHMPVDCAMYEGDPKAALPDNMDLSNVALYESVSTAAGAEAFFERGETENFYAVAFFESDTVLESSLLVPNGCGIEIGAALTVPGTASLKIYGDLILDKGATIENSGSLNIYNNIYYDESAQVKISNNSTMLVSSTCSDIAENITENAEEADFDIIYVNGTVVATAEALIEEMQYGPVTVADNMTLPAGDYIQENEIWITNGAELLFAEGAKLESRSQIKIISGTLDIRADGAEIKKTSAIIGIFSPTAHFWAGDNFKVEGDCLGVLYVYAFGEELIASLTDLEKNELTSYTEANSFEELDTAIENRTGWKYAFIECKNVELTSENCSDSDPFVIPGNVVLGLYDSAESENGPQLYVRDGAYVENDGYIEVDGSGSYVLLEIEEGSHFTNNGEIIITTPGTAEGLEYIQDGFVINDCVLYDTYGGESWWRYQNADGEQFITGKTAFMANTKLTWSMDSKYSAYATFDAKKATLTPKKLTADTEIELTATIGNKIAHVYVTLKPLATKISVYGNGENISGKKVNVNVNDSEIPFYINILPSDSYYELTAAAKSTDFFITYADNYILLFKDEVTYNDFCEAIQRGEEGYPYFAAIIELYDDGGGTLYIINKDDCIQSTGAGKTFTLTAASGKLKTSATVTFVESGEGIVFGGDLAEENVVITGGEKLTLKADFTEECPSDSIAWEFDDGESSVFASIKTTKGVTTLTTNKVTAATTIRVRAYSVNNPWGCYEVKEIQLRPAATTAQIYKVLENENGETYYEAIADKAKIFVTTETGKYNLSGSLMPDGESSGALWNTVEFTSKNPGVVSIKQDDNSEDAELTFNKAGVSAVTLTYKNAAGKVIKSSTVTFTVRDPFTITLNTDKDEITAGASAKEGGQATITAAFDKKPANNKLVWSLKDEYLSDWITLKASGTKCTVTAKAGCDWKQLWEEYGEEHDDRVYIVAQSAETEEISAEIAIAVKPKNSSILLYTYEWNEYGSYDVNLTGQTSYMNATEELAVQKVCIVDKMGGSLWIYNGSSMWNNLVWKSSSAKVATVDQYGLVEAKAKGTAKITASYTFASGLTVSGEYTVRVGTRTDSIEIRPLKEDIPVVSGKSFSFAAYDSNTGKKVNAVFSLNYGSEFASVTSAGAVKAVSGLAERKWVGIKAVLKDNPDVEAYYDIELWPAATNMIIWTKLNEGDGIKSDGKTFNVAIRPSGNGYIHDKVQLQVSQYPGESYYAPKFTLPKGVSIDSEGYLTFSKPGTYTIKVTAGDGSGKSSQVKFNVQRAVETIEAEVTYKGKNVTLKAVLNGGNKKDAPKNSKVTWSLLYASDEAYCTLTSAGKFTAKTSASGREVQVVVTAQDNGLKDIVTVTIP